MRRSMAPEILSPMVGLRCCVLGRREKRPPRDLRVVVVVVVVPVRPCLWVVAGWRRREKRPPFERRVVVVVWRGCLELRRGMLGGLYKDVVVLFVGGK